MTIGNSATSHKEQTPSEKKMRCNDPLLVFNYQSARFIPYSRPWERTAYDRHGYLDTCYIMSCSNVIQASPERRTPFTFQDFIRLLIQFSGRSTFFHVDLSPRLYSSTADLLSRRPSLTSTFFYGYRKHCRRHVEQSSCCFHYLQACCYD